MTNKTIKLHELTGIIINKEPRKVYNKDSPYHGNNFYKLTITNHKNKEEFIFVYPNLVSPQIFQTIQQSQYIDKKYLFFCVKKPKRWILHQWEELPSFNTSSESLEIQTTHEQKK